MQKTWVSNQVLSRKLMRFTYASPHNFALRGDYPNLMSIPDSRLKICRAQHGFFICKDRVFLHLIKCKKTLAIYLVGSALLVHPSIAFACIGPGLGAGVVAAVLGAVAGILMLIVGVLWYPVKRLILRLKLKKSRCLLSCLLLSVPL
jgi:hypothetical protein